MKKLALLILAVILTSRAAFGSAFDPLKITVTRIQGRWKIVSGRHGLFDFGQHQSDARQALAIIRQHGFNQSCAVGPPEADFSYLRR